MGGICLPHMVRGQVQGDKVLMGGGGQSVNGGAHEGT